MAPSGSRIRTGSIAGSSSYSRMRCLLAGCALLAGSPVAAMTDMTPSVRLSLGSSRTATDIRQCLSTKLADVGAASDAATLPTTSFDFGSGKNQITIEIVDSDDLRLVTVKAFHKLKPARQNDIRSCMY